MHARDEADDLIEAFRHLPRAQRREVREALSLDETDAIEAGRSAARATIEGKVLEDDAR